MPQLQQKSTAPPPPPGYTIDPDQSLPSGYTLDSAPQSATPPEIDSRNGFQRAVDKAASPDSPQVRATRGPVSNALNDLGRGATEMLFSPIAHPIQTVTGLAKTAGKLAMHHDPIDPENPLTNIVPSVVNDFKDNGAQEAIPHLIGQAAGAYAGGELTGGIGSAALKPLKAASNPMVRAGMDTLNAYAGQTLPMIRRGQSPGAALLDEGLVPAMSRHSIVQGVENAAKNRGSQIGSLVDNSPSRISLDKTAPAVDNPINAAKGIVEGPGGNKNVGPLETLRSSMSDVAPGAKTPAYRSPMAMKPPQSFDPTAAIHNIRTPQGTADVSAPDLWRTIQNIDRNTRFNPDPEVEGLNEIKRDVRGNLRPILEDAVPGLKPLSSKYSDLMAAQEALERTGKPGKFTLSRSALGTPVTTGTGAALVNTGKALQNVDMYGRPIGRNLFMGAVTPQENQK